MEKPPVHPTEEKEYLEPPKIAILEDKREFADALKNILLTTDEFKLAEIDWIDPAGFPPTETLDPETIRTSEEAKKINESESSDFQKRVALEDILARESRKIIPIALTDLLKKYDLVLLDNELSYDRNHYKGEDIVSRMPIGPKIMSISGDEVNFGEEKFYQKAALLKFPDDKTKEKFLGKVKKILGLDK